MTQTDRVKLTAQQEKAMRYLLDGLPIIHTAEQIGVSERTIHRWLVSPLFREKYDAGQRTIFEETLSTMRLRVKKALDTLSAIMDDESSPQASRVRAASVILEHAVATYKLADIEVRVRTLEEARERKDARANARFA